MNRRSFLGLLASVPFLNKIPKMAVADPHKLTESRGARVLIYGGEPWKGR